MATDISSAVSGSAQIYQFPVGGRDGLRARQQPPVMASPVKVAVGGSWYHDEAIREERSRDH